jgi:hypothetical protein
VKIVIYRNLLALLRMRGCLAKRDVDVQLGDEESASSKLDPESEPGASETESAAMQTGASIENVVFPKGAAAYPGSNLISFTNKMSDATDPEIVIFSNLETNVRRDDRLKQCNRDGEGHGLDLQAGKYLGADDCGQCIVALSCRA